MKTKQEQIEEMEKIIKAEYKQWLDITGVIPEGTTYYAECLGCAIDSAETLYNVAGYRKIPENAVVLTKEEYIDLSRNYVTEQIEQVRKKTAKEILLLLGKGYDETEKTEFNNLQWYKEFCRELKHRYGVEVEE